METSSPGQRLTHQHRRIDAGIKAIADGTGQVDALTESLALLRLHLYVEEELLFPPLVRAGLTMPVFVMKREHGEMWPLLETLAAGCDAKADLASLREPALQLFRQLQVHNGKEEEVVYTAAARMLAAGGGASIATLDAARLPDGWACAMAPH